MHVFVGSLLPHSLLCQCAVVAVCCALSHRESPTVTAQSSPCAAASSLSSAQYLPLVDGLTYSTNRVHSGSRSSVSDCNLPVCPSNRRSPERQVTERRHGKWA
ncbi:hypothetical protein GUJ93_ZPchr0004g40177 [Zizania palustris]|uniref:Secreted protein n=1 Tax=Zizania palustris TaxID=103762 RepID=A0A8J5SKK9_ZIZPA|nr:hypothetical protein GUJ93_ZPchr0004g40177 [Zizania palustris]